MANFKHGYSGTRAYASWKAMRNRCRTKYAGRFTIDPSWDTFEGFYKDMGDPPYRWYTLEREDNSKGYCKDNCCWATPKQQGNNTRRNVYMTFQERTQTMKQWSEELGISTVTLLRRRKAFGKNDPRVFAIKMPGSPLANR